MFDVSVYSVVAFPTRWDGEPWDWDGQVPDWLFGMIDDLQWGLDRARDLGLMQWSSELATFSEVVDAADLLAGLIDEHAPDLLYGTVPPDMYVEFAYADSESWESIGFTEYVADSYRADVHSMVRGVELWGDESLVLWTYDADLVFDDDVGGWALNQRFMRDIATCGPFSLGPACRFRSRLVRRRSG